MSTEMNTTDQNKAVIRRLIEECWNKRDWSMLDELFAPTLIRYANGVRYSHDDNKKNWPGIFQTYPDFQVTIEDMLADGDKVITRWAGHGTYHAAQPDDPADGEKWAWQATAIHRIQGGRIVENYDTIHSEIVGVSEAQNKAAACRFYEEGWNKGTLAVLDEILAPNVVRHNAVLADREAYREFIAQNLNSNPDMHFTLEDVIAEGDKVVIRWTVRGTNTGPRPDGPPTGKTFEISGMNIFRFAGGKIVEAWVNADTLLMQQQLGLIPTT